jgi:MFS family permease
MTSSVAIPWQIYLLSNKNAHALGAIGLAKALPLIGMAVFGGLVADTFDRRRLLLATQTCLLAISTVLAVAAATGHTTEALLYATSAASGLVTAVDLPARQALVPNLVPRAVLSRALSLNNVSFQLAHILGPGLGGIALAAFGAPWVYAIDATTFLAFIAGIGLVAYRPDEKKPRARPGIAAIVEGIRFIASQPILSSTMILDFLATFFAESMYLMPIFANDILGQGGGEKRLGFLQAAPATGALVTALFLVYRSIPRRAGAAVIGAVAVFGLAWAGFGCTTSFPLALALLAVAGASDTLSAVVRQTLRQELTPDEIRGRMTSLNMIFFVGGPLLGEYESGVVAHYFKSAPIAVQSGGIACVLVAVIFAFGARALRTYDRAT